MLTSQTTTRFGGLLAVFLAALVAACSSSPPPATAPATDPDPGLRPGDVVRVAVWREEDLSGEFQVDDRGIVTLPLLGDRDVNGMQGPELRDQLVEQYREYLQNPSIEVTVLRRVNILGAVNMPGLYPVDQTISLAEALGMAGGISPTGDEDEIKLYRGGAVLYDDLDRAALVSDIDIRSGDRIVVPEKGWLERNPGALIGSLIGVAGGITIALIR